MTKRLVAAAFVAVTFVAGFAEAAFAGGTWT